MISWQTGEISFVAAEQTRKEEERNMITNNLKVDQFTKMGINRR